MASYKIRTAGNCPAVLLLSGLRSILESDAGTRCRYDCCSQAILRSFNDCCRRDYSSLPLRKLESDADHLSRNDRCRRNHSSLPLRKLESDTGHRSSDDRCRRNHSSLPQRKLESDADHLSRNGRCRRAIPHCCDDGAAVIRKSGPEIKNRCSNEAVFGQSMQRFPN